MKPNKFDIQTTVGNKQKLQTWHFGTWCLDRQLDEETFDDTSAAAATL